MTAYALWSGPVTATDTFADILVLPNGLRSVVIEDRDAPGVLVSAWYAAGAADEAGDEKGIAHWLEHLLFWGRPDHPLGAFADAIEARGGVTDARTSYDFTGYWTEIDTGALDFVLAVEAARMDFSFDAGVAERERGLVAEEREARVEAFPAAVFDEQRRAALFLVHPYGHPVIGWPAEIAALDLDRARAFHAQAYRPANAIVVIVGDVDREAAQAAVAAAFRGIEAGVPLPRQRPAEPVARAARWVEMRDARVKAPAVGRLYPAPVRRPGDQDDAAALAVLEALLGDMAGAWLNETLVVPGLAAEVGANHAALGVDPQTFGIFAALPPGGDPAALEAALDKAIADFLARAPDAASVEAAKAFLARGLAEPGDRLDVARAWGTALATGLAPADIDAWPEALAAVGPDDVIAVARHVLRPEASVTGRLLPGPGSFDME